MAKSNTPKNVSPEGDDRLLTVSELAELKQLRKAKYEGEQERLILKKATVRSTQGCVALNYEVDGFLTENG